MRLLLLALLSWAQATGAELRLTSPADYQVVQRSKRHEGALKISGSCEDADDARLEVRLIDPQGKGDWRITGRIVGASVQATLDAPAGGWYRLEARLTKDGKTVAEASVAHVGVGEVFLVAGQSNSANHGEEKQAVKSGLVASCDGKVWQVAHDPQRGASGKGGSFLPPLGDALVAKFGVPVGFVPIGIGATSVREWLPAGVAFPSPPTLLSRVKKRPDGGWESNGAAYGTLVSRLKLLGLRGFRAVLWHQGESDANQKDPTRTLPGALYQGHLSRIIADSRQAVGWDVPWFVAQVSYHVPGDEASEDIRAAQASLWQRGMALAGPDSDALKGELRERGGQGVHFSGPGLRRHADAWAEKITPWLEQELRQ